MALKDCVLEAAPELGEDYVEAAVETVERRVQRHLEGQSGDTLENLLKTMKSELRGSAERNKAMRMRATALRVVKEAKALETMKAAVMDQGWGYDESLKSMLVGTILKGKGAEDSVAAAAARIERSSMGEILAAMEEKGAQGFFDDISSFNAETRRQIDADFVRELVEYNTTGKTGVSGNKKAAVAAESIGQRLKKLLVRANNEGADIGDLTGWVYRDHDVAKLTDAGFDKWSREISQHIDWTRTANGMLNGDTAGQRDFLSAAFDNLIGGGDEVFEFAASPKGRKILAQKMSQSRVLHLKDAAAELKYNELYGRVSITEGVLAQIGALSRKIALMTKFGPDPEAAFRNLLEYAKKESAMHHKAEGSPQRRFFLRRMMKTFAGEGEGVRPLTPYDEKIIQRRFDLVTGKLDTPDRPSLAKWSQSVRNIHVSSKLGGAVWSQITDIPIRAAHAHGIGMDGKFMSNIRALGDVSRMVTGREKGEFRKVTRALGVGYDGMVGSILGRVTGEDIAPGMTAKLADTVLKLSGMNRFTDVTREGVVLALSNYLGSSLDTAFSKLHKGLREALERSGITEKEWSLLQQYKKHLTDIDGNTFLTPDAVDAIPDRKFGSSKAVQQVNKDELKDKIGQFFLTETFLASPTPGMRERSILLFGSKPGDALGELARHMTLFKSFPVMMVNKILPRMYQSGGLDGIASLVALMTVFGYGAMSMKDLTKGRMPRDPSDPKTWLAAGTQGGGFGILGDFLLGEYNRYGQSVWSTLGGPSAGLADDIGRLYTAAKSGDDIAAKLVSTTTNYLPGSNLWYTRLALNHLVFFRLQEMLNPGYLKRKQAKTIKQNNTQFWMAPTDNPFGR